MKKIGTWLVIFGAGSALLNSTGYEIKILSWIDAWGPTTGWVIRGGLVVVGVALWLAGHRAASTAEATAQPAPKKMAQGGTNY